MAKTTLQQMHSPELTNALDASNIINFTIIAEAQQRNETLQRLTTNPTSLQFKEVPLPTSEGRIVSNVSTGDLFPQNVHIYSPTAGRRKRL